MIKTTEIRRKQYPQSECTSEYKRMPHLNKKKNGEKLKKSKMNGKIGLDTIQKARHMN